MTPLEIVDALITDFETLQSIYEETDGYLKRNHLNQLMGLKLESLIPAIRHLIDTDEASPSWVTRTDIDECNLLEAQAAAHLTQSSRIAKMSDQSNPFTDLDQMIAFAQQAVVLRKSADRMFDKVRVIVSRHTHKNGFLQA